MPHNKTSLCWYTPSLHSPAFAGKRNIHAAHPTPPGALNMQPIRHNIRVMCTLAAAPDIPNQKSQPIGSNADGACLHSLKLLRINTPGLCPQNT